MDERRPAPVETKVGAAAVASYLSTAGLLAVLARVQDGERLLDGLSDRVTPLLLALVPAAVTFTAGWWARHTPRMRGR